MKKTKIEYWIEKYPNKTIEECEKLRSDYSKSLNYQCIEYYQKRYPELSLYEQEELLKQAKQKSLKNHKSIAGKNNPMHKSKTTLQQRRECSPNSIEFYNKRYPDLTQAEREEMLLKHRENVRNKVKNAVKSTNIEYYLNQGMSLEDAKQALHDRQSTFTLEKCIKRHGEIKGTEIYNNRQINWLKKVKQNFENNRQYNKQHNSQSNLQLEIFNIIKNTIPNITNEYLIIDNKTNKKFYYDICYNNKLVEIQGDYWHANPKFYDETFYNKVLNKTAKEIWTNDSYKKLVAKHNNMKIKYIWENDYKTNPEREINKIIKFLLK